MEALPEILPESDSLRITAASATRLDTTFVSNALVTTSDLAIAKGTQSEANAQETATNNANGKCNLYEPGAKGTNACKPVGKFYNCPVCGKVFKHNGDFKRHLLTHSLIKPFSCNECGKQFAQKGNLMIHIRTHTGEKPFTCKECGKKYVQKGHLNEHMRTHSGEKPFDCTVCFKKFSRKCDLCEHMRIHTGEKPYSCPLCGKQFAQKGNLTAHMRSHTGERPFNCTRCGKKFGDKSNLKKHVQKCNNRAPYECPMCKEQYLDLLEMNDHLKEHENKASSNCEIESSSLLKVKLIEKLTQNSNKCVPYECPMCKEQFYDFLKMVGHLKQHGTEIANHIEPSLQNSLKLHENRTADNYEPTLLLQMKLLEKLRQSTSSCIPYECPLCKEHFIDILEMKEHLKQHESKAVSDSELSSNDLMSQCESEAMNEYDIEPSSLLEIQLEEQREVDNDIHSYKDKNNDFDEDYVEMKNDLKE